MRASAIAFAIMCLARGEQRFPEFKAAPLLLVGEWDQAEAVVIGDIQKARPIGAQPSVHLSWPIPEGAYTVYWCESEFHVAATIKGIAPPSSATFVWGAGVPGCSLPSGSGGAPAGKARFRVWFIRTEGDYLRPIADYGARYFLELGTRWTQGPDPGPRLARLILSSNVSAPFPEPARLACWILGQQECVPLIRARLAEADPDIRREGCEFLVTELNLECSPEHH